MKETLQDNFRQWYMEYKKVFGKYPFFKQIIKLKYIKNISIYNINKLLFV